MGGVIGPLTLPLQGSTLASLPNPAGTFTALVVATGNGLAVQLPNTQIPLPPSATFTPGRQVTVRIDPGTQSIQIQPAPQQQTASRPPLLEVLQQVLQRLPGLENTPARSALRLLPPQLPVSRPAIQTLFALITANQGVGPELARVITLLSGATKAGILPPETVLQLERLLGPRDGTRADHHLQALRSAAGHAAKSLEAALLANSGNPAAHLRGLLSSLLNNEDLRAFLKTEGQLKAFTNAATAVNERLAATSVQNLHAIDMPYLYMEIPFPNNETLQHLRVHAFLHDKRRHPEDADRDDRLSIDLSTTRLGNLWVDLHTVGEVCQCRLNADAESTRRAIEQNRDDLESSLRNAGFREVSILTSPWDGDRWSKAAALFNPPGQLDLKA